MSLLAIDIGTTTCKVGLFAPDGRVLQVAARPMPREVDLVGMVTYSPDTIWQLVVTLIDIVTAAAGRPTIAVIGVASMAETGLLLDRTSGLPRTPFLPWFDQTAASAAQLLADQAPALERFQLFGIHPSFKCSLAKILWARGHMPGITDGAIWLSAADYLVYRLTGVYATDLSLAGRTYAFQLQDRTWATDWLRSFDLPGNLFPDASPSGAPLGMTRGNELLQVGIGPGVPVAVSGHDHLCAAFAASAGLPGRALDSMGTAEVLVGGLAHVPLDQTALGSGLAFGHMPGTDQYYWLGSLSAAGGSLDWLRGILGEPALSYAEIQALQANLGQRPGAVLFLPYLAGSGTPYPNPEARGAFLGLRAGNTRADLLQAVFEGTAYQMEAVRRAAAAIVTQPIDTIIAAGGGTRNRGWLQIKADIYGQPIQLLATEEATLFGAGLIAALGCGVYHTLEEALNVAGSQRTYSMTPDPERHRDYARQFEEVFQPWQEQLTRPAGPKARRSS